MPLLELLKHHWACKLGITLSCSCTWTYIWWHGFRLEWKLGEGNFGHCNILQKISNLHRVKLLLRTVFLTSFGGELGLNGFSTSGGFLVSFNGGRAENGNNNNHWIINSS